jgi:hypothetical protein
MLRPERWVGLQTIAYLRQEHGRARKSKTLPMVESPAKFRVPEEQGDVSLGSTRLSTFSELC